MSACGTETTAAVAAGGKGDERGGALVTEAAPEIFGLLLDVSCWLEKVIGCSPSLEVRLGVDTGIAKGFGTEEVLVLRTVGGNKAGGGCISRVSVGVNVDNEGSAFRGGGNETIVVMAVVFPSPRVETLVDDDDAPFCLGGGGMEITSMAELLP